MTLIDNEGRVTLHPQAVADDFVVSATSVINSHLYLFVMFYSARAVCLSVNLPVRFLPCISALLMCIGIDTLLSVRYRSYV